MLRCFFSNGEVGRNEFIRVGRAQRTGLWASLQEVYIRLLCTSGKLYKFSAHEQSIYYERYPNEEMSVEGYAQSFEHSRFVAEYIHHRRDSASRLGPTTPTKQKGQHNPRQKSADVRHVSNATRLRCVGNGTNAAKKLQNDPDPNDY